MLNPCNATTSCLMTAPYAAQGRNTPGVKDNGRQLTIDDKLPLEDRQLVVRRALNTDQQDAQDYLERVRARFDRCAKISCTCMATYQRLAHVVGSSCTYCRRTRCCAPACPPACLRVFLQGRKPLSSRA